MIKSICLFFLLGLSQGILGQGVLLGKVVSETGEPLPFANVILQEKLDTTYIIGTATDEYGNFTLAFDRHDDFLLTISMIGYTSSDKLVTLDKSEIKLDQIILNEDGEMMDEVTISAKKPLYERQSDRIVVNVQNTITSAGSNALEILERSPGVVIDRLNNNLSLLGKNGVIVTINGKRTRLEAQALIQLLATTPSSNIKKIELISSPSAEYDAQGDGGVINIVMVKNEMSGFNGHINFFGGMGQRGKYGGGLNFNARHHNINIYGDFSTSSDFLFHQINLNQKIQYIENIVHSHQQNNRPAYQGNHAGKIGVDLDLGENLSVGSFFAGSLSKWDLQAISETEYLTPLGDVSFETLSSHEINNNDHYMISNNFTMKTNTESKWSIDLDYLNYQADNPTNYLLTQTTTDDVSQSVNFESAKRTPIDIWVFKSDYTSKIFSDIEIALGIKSTISKIENDTRLTYYLPEPTNRPLFTDINVMNEDIYAAYTSFNGKLGARDEYRLGFRYENYDLVLDSEQNGRLINRRVGNLFPSFSFSRQLNEANSITFSYHERINRPGFQTLAPALYFFDTHSALSGNINILPTLSRTVTANLSLGTLYFSLSYSDEDDPLTFGQPRLEGNEDILILNSENYVDRDLLSLNISTPVRITSFWNSRYNANIIYRKEVGHTAEGSLSQSRVVFYGNFAQNLELPHNWQAEVTGTFNSKFNIGLSTFKPRLSLNLGVSKVFKNQSKISLAWNDLFDSGSFFGIITDRPSENIFYDWNYDLEGNVVRLSFSTPFGNVGLKTKDRRQSGSDDIQQRATN